ncbi:hypothetical protein [Burkholderia mallei]|uniref:hypothetical protein n=1 Tax=Burkholderia mallei TaxID=13373 RepID=UPI003BEF2322
MPDGGLNIRWPDPPLVQEARLLDYKWYAALAYVRANKLQRASLEAALQSVTLDDKYTLERGRGT